MQGSRNPHAPKTSLSDFDEQIAADMEKAIFMETHPNASPPPMPPLGEFPPKYFVPIMPPKSTGMRRRVEPPPPPPGIITPSIPTTVVRSGTPSRPRTISQGPSPKHGECENIQPCRWRPLTPLTPNIKIPQGNRRPFVRSPSFVKSSCGSYVQPVTSTSAPELRANPRSTMLDLSISASTDDENIHDDDQKLRDDDQKLRDDDQKLRDDDQKLRDELSRKLAGYPDGATFFLKKDFVLPTRFVLLPPSPGKIPNLNPQIDRFPLIMSPLPEMKFEPLREMSFSARRADSEITPSSTSSSDDNIDTFCFVKEDGTIDESAELTPKMLQPEAKQE